MDATSKLAIAWNTSATHQQLVTADQTRRAQRAQSIAVVRATTINLLISLGATVHAAPADRPVVDATVPHAGLAKFLDPAFAPDVVLVEVPAPKGTATVKSSNEFFYASDDMEAKEAFVDQGKEAYGIRVGIIEGDDPCGIWKVGNLFFFDWANYVEKQPTDPSLCVGKNSGDPCGPLLGTNCSSDTLGFCRMGLCVSQHTTQVASSIGARPMYYPSSNRLANRAAIYFANQGLRYLRWEWFADNLVHVVNDSESSEDTDAANWAMRNDLISIAHAAGNYSNASTEACDCFANAICVGAAYIDDPYNETDHWKADPQNASGTYHYVPGFHYRNGIQSRLIPDVEKPDVLAIDDAPLLDPEIGYWKTREQFSIGGTSFSAPKIVAPGSNRRRREGLRTGHGATIVPPQSRQ